MEYTHWEFCTYYIIFGQKALKIFLYYVYKSIANELKRLKC